MFIGKCPEVNYLSDKKDGKIRLYKHKLKKHGNWLAIFNKKGRIETLIVSNVDLDAKDVGLVG